MSHLLYWMLMLLLLILVLIFAGFFYQKFYKDTLLTVKHCSHTTRNRRLVSYTQHGHTTTATLHLGWSLRYKTFITYCNCPVHLTTTIHWQRSERPWGNHYNALQRNFCALICKQVIPSPMFWGLSVCCGCKMNWAAVCSVAVCN